MNYSVFIENNIKLPYVYNMIIADLNGNIIDSDGTMSDDEAAISALLYQNTIQIGKELHLGDPRSLSFSCNNHKIIIVKRYEHLICSVLDKNISSEKYLVEMDNILQRIEDQIEE